MKNLNLKVLLAGFMFTSSVYFTACKSKPKDTGNTIDTTSVATPKAEEPAPVVIAENDSLKIGVRDAVKDHPKVKADVNNGEITLTGEIQRSKLPGLMQSLSSLRPKKINNQLTIK